jgi:Flp pilus assembly protein TadG
VRPVRRLRGNDRLGASLVEFAIVSNLLLITILTCMEFARMNMVRNLAQDAAYYAARHAIVPGATPGEAVAEASRIMGSLLNNGYTVRVSPLDGDSRFVDVTVSVNMGEVALFAPLFLPQRTVDTRVRMRTERYSGFFQQ